MKKVFSFMLAICLIIPCAMFFVACGENPAGTYQVTSVSFGSISITREQYEAMSDTEKEDYSTVFEMKMALNEDGTVTQILGEETEDNGTWEFKDGKIVITTADTPIATISAEYKDNSFTMEMMGTTVVYSKI